MPRKATDIAKLSNAFSTGGGGGEFERRVQAVFALALFVDGFSPIIDLPVQKLEFQAKHLDYDVDDLVVTGSDGYRCAKLLCQIKHDLVVSDNNSTFQEVITAAWSDFNKAGFNRTSDKIALITSFIAKDSIQALRSIHEQALDDYSPEAFVQRFNQANFIGKRVQEKFNTIRTCIDRANASPISDEEMWKFCRCFVLAVFDIDYENSVNRILAKSLIRCKSEEKPNLVWSRLSDQCGDWKQHAASVSRDNIPSDIQELFGIKQEFTTLANVRADFSPNNTWATIALIGRWDEHNEYDVSALEQLVGVPYGVFQHECRDLLLSHPGLLSLKNGLWKLANRKNMLENVREQYFDDTIKSAFQIASSFLTENSKQITEDGEFSIVIPASGRFSNSDSFRSGLLEGLCILANGPQLSHCSDNLLHTETSKLIRNVLSDADWVRLVSVSDEIDFLAEMNPSAYLENLEKLIQSHPAEVKKLFPKKDNYALANWNFSTSILFTLERLAWSEESLVPCIRCLGELECLGYEQTNWANTPINTIVKILSPFSPQTRAPIDKQKNALQGLKIDHPELCWSVLTALLPQNGSYTATGSAKPRFMDIIIPDDIEISDDDRTNLFQYYIHQAITMAGSNKVRLAQLSEQTAYMLAEDILSYLNTIETASATWDDSAKCDLWIKLSELKYQILIDNSNTAPDTLTYNALCRTIDSVCPESIFYQHKRLYLSHFNEFLADENRWEEHEEKKQRAVEEIYKEMGLEAVIAFGNSIDALHDVGRYMGKGIDSETLKIILPKYQKGENTNFYSILLRTFLHQNGISALDQLDLPTYDPHFVAIILKDAPFEQGLIDRIPKYLPNNEALFWGIAVMPPYYPGYSDYNLREVIQVLLKYNRAPAAIDALGHNIEKINIDNSLMYEILMRAPAEKGTGQLHQYTVRKMIKYLQNTSNADIDALSEIEYVYLPWLDHHSSTKPRAINYKLANNAKCFCDLMEATYKKRHEDAVKTDLPKAVSERLFQLTFNYSNIPGTDWNGIFCSDRFKSWIAEVKAWAKANDRFEVTMQTVGNGLSHAKFNNDNVIERAIMEELNLAENEEMRQGYQLGVYNQRGAHWVDPEGKPERALADKYKKRADAVEQLGYTRFAGTLREISESYIAEAEENTRYMHAVVD